MMDWERKEERREEGREGEREHDFMIQAWSFGGHVGCVVCHFEEHPGGWLS